MPKKRKNTAKSRYTINCNECKNQADCCRIGAWIDLEEAKKILELGLKGDFFHLEKDKSFPSGYRIGTSIEDEPCTFLDRDGLCSIHKADFSFKPQTCIQFPYEDNKLSDYADVLCTLHKSRRKNKKTKKKKK